MRHSARIDPVYSGGVRRPRLTPSAHKPVLRTWLELSGEVPRQNFVMMDVSWGRCGHLPPTRMWTSAAHETRVLTYDFGGGKPRRYVMVTIVML